MDYVLYLSFNFDWKLSLIVTKPVGVDASVLISNLDFIGGSSLLGVDWFKLIDDMMRLPIFFLVFIEFSIYLINKL